MNAIMRPSLSSDRPQQPSGIQPETRADVPRVSRRDLLAGGGLLLGSVLLQACAGKKYSDSLPDPIAPSENPQVQQWAASALDGWNAPSIPFLPMPATMPIPMPPDPSLSGDVLPRSAWTRAGVARPRDIYALGGINRITIHHDGITPTIRAYAMRDVATRIEQIRQSHVAGRGWADIGYHFVVDPAGRVWEARSTRYQGAHVKDQNENNLGILVLGNFEVQQPTQPQLAAVDRFVSQQITRYRVSMGRVRTHREIAQTECPGRNLQSYLVRTRNGGGVMARMASA